MAIHPLKLLVSTCLALAALTTTVARAHETPGNQLDVPGFGAVAYEHLFTDTSQAGESLDAFVLRLAPRLRDYSKRTGFEACGVLASDGRRFGAVIGTNYGHTVCVNVHAYVPAGMAHLPQTIHSHPGKKDYRANATDKLVLSRLTRLGAVVRGAKPEEFSREDFAAPGYLVSPTRVWHQAGEGTARVVGVL